MFGSCLDDSKCGIGACDPTAFSVIAYVVHHSMECELHATDADFFSSASFGVCLQAHLSPNLQPPGDLNVVHSGTCQKLHEFLFGNFLS